MFLEPAADRPLIDFHLYLQEAMTDTILSLARVIREETGSNRLSIAFYGYLFEHAGIANGPAVSGHYALRRLLDSADIDIVSGPISYHDRQLGGISTTMKKAVVLLSGGLDSATALAIAKSEGFECHALSFGYGQRHSCELKAAEQVAKQLGAADHKTVTIDLRLWGGSALTDDNLAVPDAAESKGIPITYVPARNLIFLSFATA